MVNETVTNISYVYFSFLVHHEKDGCDKRDVIK